MQPDQFNNRPGNYRPTVPPTPGPRRFFAMSTTAGLIKSRASNVIDSDDEIQELGEQSDTATEHLFEIIVGTQSGDRLQASLEQSLFINIVDAANQLPGGSAVTESQWQVIGPYRSLYKVDGTVAEDGEQVFHTYARNISAGTCALLVRYRISYIANRGNALA